MSSLELLRIAENAGVLIGDKTSKQETARWTAMREWKARSKDSYPDADVFGVKWVENDKYKGQDLDVVAHGDEFNAMESGPMEEPFGPKPQTSSGWFIYEVILPEVLEHFFAKNAEYGDRHRSSKFGAAGEIVGIDRKVDKLIESLWKGKKLQFEQPKEMLWDVIGSALLALDLIAQQEAREGVPG